MREVRIQSVDEFIDSQPVSSHQRRVTFFCFVVAVLDGFDAGRICRSGYPGALATGLPQGMLDAAGL